MAIENVPLQETHETLKISTSSDPKHFPKMLLIGLAAGLIIIIGAGIGYFLGVNNAQQPTPEPMVQVTQPSSTPTPDPTANWKTYTNTAIGFSFKYPSSLKIANETSSSASLVDISGQSNAMQITFSNNPSIFKNYKLCSEYNLPPDQFPPTCISSGKSWGQNEDIEDFYLDGTAAKSFYITSGVDSAEHAMQTINDPIFEIKMNVAGGGLDDLFRQILSTFKFTQ